MNPIPDLLPNFQHTSLETEKSPRFHNDGRSAQATNVHPHRGRLQAETVRYLKFLHRMPCHWPASGFTRADTRLELRGECSQFPERDSLANLAHCVKEKRNIVVGVQDGGQNLIGLKQVPR